MNKHPEIPSLLVSGLVFGIITLLFFYILIFLPSLPVVYWSVSENRCVAIEVQGEKIDCSTLNNIKRYERVWVK